jgi:hypothetical protein
MGDLLKLIWYAAAGLFRSRGKPKFSHFGISSMC